MKKICFWTPYIGNIGTIKATISSAAIIKKHIDCEVGLFKIYGEWEGYEGILKKNSLDIIDFCLKNFFKKLPSYGVFSRLTMLITMIYSIPKLINYFNKKKPDIVFSYLQGITPLIARCFSVYKPKIFLSVQGLPSFLAPYEIYKQYPIWKKIESSIRIFIWKKLYLKADKIITLTKTTQLDLIKFFNSDEKKIIYIPNPIVDEDIVKKSNESIKDDNYLNGGYIIGVGRLTAQKDFKTLISAFKIVSEYIDDINLIILGEGEEKGRLQNLIDYYGLSSRVYLYGFVLNPYKYIKNAKIFVLSSLWEDPGHVLIEAAYLKVPIVATDCPNDVSKFLSNGKAGYLCKISNDVDMADKIMFALQNKNDEKIDLAYNNSLLFSNKTFLNKILRVINEK